MLRKTLGKVPAEKLLSCWAWFVGNSAEQFEFGAHDFRGCSYETAMQESVSGNSTTIAHGKLHMVVVVVKQTTLSFWTDTGL